MGISVRTGLTAVYKSLVLRILLGALLLLALLVYVGYNYWALPWLDRTLGDVYFQQTGHKLEHDKPLVNLRGCTLNLSNLKDSTGLWQAKSVEIKADCAASFHARGFIAKDISIDGLQAKPIQQGDGRWNFDDILKHQAKINPPAVRKQPNQPVAVAIKNVAIKNARIDSNALPLNNLALAITPLNITLVDIDLRKPTQSFFTLNGKLNKNTPLSASGKLDLQQLNGELDVTVESVPLIWFNEFVKPFVALDILHGDLQARAHIQLVDGLPLYIRSQGKFTEFKVKPTTMEQDAVKWKSLTWEAGDIHFKNKEVHIPLITLNEFDGQIIITKDRITNIQAMIIKPVPEAAPAQDRKAQPAEEPASAAWKFTVDKLAVNNAAVGFSDESLKPSFMAIVQQLNGEILHISNDEKTEATLSLNGNVDGYAPVVLRSKANLFVEQPNMETLISFQKMDLGAFSPYFAEYAGWKIKKGLLSVDLNYRYENGLIVGKNHVVIDHLQFGEKVRGARIIDMPLRLGLALLTDEKGVAVLDADISGDPHQPSFNIRETIWRAVRNTLKKVTTAPFRFIANLLKTKEDLGSVTFTPGESQLLPDTISKIELLKQAMDKRPKMRLTIHGVYDETLDAAALKREQVNTLLQKQGLPREFAVNHTGNWADAVNKLYKTQGLPETHENTHEKLSVEEKYEALAARETLLPERLHRLANERGQAIKQYFVLKLGVASEMLLLDTENTCDKTHICAASAAFFSLEE